MKTSLLAAGFVLVSAIAARTQDARFDVASVKQNTAGPTSMLSAFRGRRFTARYVTVKSLICTAYGQVEHTLANEQVSGGPGWLESDRFDIEGHGPGHARLAAGDVPGAVLTMLRGLLEERFQLQVHFVTKELPVFALTLARRDGILGPGLRRRTTDCVAGQPAPREPRNLFNPAAVERRACGGQIGPGTVTARGLMMTNLVSALTRIVPDIDRIVVDRTGLAGTYDVDLTWRFETDDPTIRAQLPPPDPNAPSLFTALQEQLGLKLEPTKGPVDVLVIDRVEHPSND